MRVNRAILPQLRQQKSGLVINFSSGLARFLIPLMGIYYASKWTSEGLIESMRYELTPLGIDIVIVQLGALATTFGDKVIQPTDQEWFTSYGSVTEFTQQFMTGFAERMASDEAPNPQNVTNTIIQLIETPVGQRPIVQLLVRMH